MTDVDTQMGAGQYQSEREPYHTRREKMEFISEKDLDQETSNE